MEKRAILNSLLRNIIKNINNKDNQDERENFLETHKLLSLFKKNVEILILTRKMIETIIE